MNSSAFEYLKIVFHRLFPKYFVTLLVGVFAKAQFPHLKNFLIKNFIRHYAVNMQEAAEENPCQYKTFNDFFIRPLKPNCRKISTAAIISPVDGRVSEIGTIHKGQLLQAKGRYYALDELLGNDSKLCAPFENGSFATLYLSPRDYHRVHMPVQGKLVKMVHIPGKLFSVQPLTTRWIPRLFARNERLVLVFETQYGPMIVVMVGATIVGTMGTSWGGDVARGKSIQCYDYTKHSASPIVLDKGAEIGYFKLGSTAIVLFPDKAKARWKSQLQPGSLILLGQELGHFEAELPPQD